MKRRKKQILPDNRISAVLITLILPILFFVFWVLGSHQAWFHSSIIPTPHKMWVQLTKMLSDRSLWNAIVFSFRRVLFWYLLGAASGVFLGILIGLYRRLNQLNITPHSAHCLHSPFHLNYGNWRAIENRLNFHWCILAMLIKYHQWHSYDKPKTHRSCGTI